MQNTKMLPLGDDLLKITLVANGLYSQLLSEIENQELDALIRRTIISKFFQSPLTTMVSPGNHTASGILIFPLRLNVDELSDATKKQICNNLANEFIKEGLMIQNAFCSLVDDQDLSMLDGKLLGMIGTTTKALNYCGYLSSANDLRLR
ncbi:hypothetical protein [uncultured Brevibacillus sp.]|uniref:hypothetical protein n=1 Tax=uncultured Brevibacillus sp. TaxID=169970 RepID=UPI0025931E7B|nr:hypothetical protein [uncultured Brevibacillus sp.]